MTRKIIFAAAQKGHSVMRWTYIIVAELGGMAGIDVAPMRHTQTGADEG